MRRLTRPIWMTDSNTETVWATGEAILTGNCDIGVIAAIQKGPAMNETVLMIMAMHGAEHCAATLERQLKLPVETAKDLQGALECLRRREYSVVIVDESVAEADSRGADLLWKSTGLAIPLQVNFAITGSSRLGREICAALGRREQEQALSMRAAATSIERELKPTVTGLLLQSQLALAEPAVPPYLVDKLKLVVELAGSLKHQLERAQA